MFQSLDLTPLVINRLLDRIQQFMIFHIRINSHRSPLVDLLP